jgi:predicted transcriptional regulator
MRDAKQREIAESLFDRNKQQEAQIKQKEAINDALAQEAARHAAAVKNMHRLRALRLAREQQDQMHKRIP